MPSRMWCCLTIRRTAAVTSMIWFRSVVLTGSVISGCDCIGQISLRPGKAPPRGQRVGGALGIVALPAPAVAKMGVGQLVRDDPADKIARPFAEGSFEDNGSTRTASPIV